MNKSGFKYLKLTAVAAVLAIILIGLSGLLSATTIAQEKRTLPDREIDLRAKLKDKKFADGRRVVIDTLDSGEKNDTHTTTDSKGKQTTVSSSWTLQIPCPGHPAGDTFK